MPGSTLSPSATTAESEVDLDLVVSDRANIADDVVALTLTRPDGSPLPEWQPGAHIDLILPNDLIRQYSLCGDPADRFCWQVAILRETDGRGGSEWVHDHLPTGAAIRVRGPRNHFPLVDAARYLFIGGGIGITPLIPMVAAATAAGAEWTLLYGGRSTTSMAFAGHLSATYGSRIILCPQDTHGLPDLDALLGAAELANGATAIYCCGPEGLLQAVESRCAKLPPGTLHVERFAPGELTAPVQAGSFEVEVGSTGEILEVRPEQSILEVLLEAGIEVDASCEEGTCGTCETSVVHGAIDHRDFVLTEEERAASTSMMVCVSRAACPRLRLDL